MEIPNGEILYRYAKPEAFPPDQLEIPAAVFQDPQMSCDWSIYQPAPETSLHMNEGRTVIILITICEEIKRPCNPRGVEMSSCFQDVIHDPLTAEQPFGPNEAHSLIRGNKKMPVIAAIRKNSTWTKAVV